MLKNNKDENITSRRMSFLIYISYIIVSIIILFDGSPLYETVFRFWVVTYLVLLFNLFIDKTPPRYLNINEWLEKGENDRYYEEYLNNILNILNITIKYIQYIEKGQYEEELEHNIKVVEASYNRLRRLKVPPKYENIQKNILKDIEEFILHFNNTALNNKNN